MGRHLGPQPRGPRRSRARSRASAVVRRARARRGRARALSHNPTDGAKEDGMTTLEQEQTRDAWETIAAGYDDYVTPTHLWLGNEAIRGSASRPGSGSWTSPREAARSASRRRVWSERHATDLSAGDARAARRTGARRGPEIETRVMDGHPLELEDDSFDLAGSQFGVMLFPDMPQAIREMARVHGPAAACCWSLRTRRPDRVPRLLPHRDPGGRPRLRGPPDGSTAAAVPGCGRGEAPCQRLAAAGLRDVASRRSPRRSRSGPGRRCGTGSCTATRSRGC